LSGSVHHVVIYVTRIHETRSQSAAILPFIHKVSQPSRQRSQPISRPGASTVHCSSRDFKDTSDFEAGFCQMLASSSAQSLTAASQLTLSILSETNLNGISVSRFCRRGENTSCSNSRVMTQLPQPLGMQTFSIAGGDGARVRRG